jgi:asparaginyl-tRNA synthetase
VSTETTGPGLASVRISDLSRHVGAEVRLQGWLYNKRSSGKLQFLIVRDGTGYVQVVVAKAAVTPESWEAGDKAGQESSVVVTGRVKEDKRAPGGYELDGTSVQVLQAVHDYPITPKDHGTAFLMERRHLWLRSQRQHAVIRVRHTVVKAVRDYLDDNGFTLVDTPIFTPAACEGTSTLFPVQYFDEGTAYLTQSGQLYNEATAAAHGKVYCFGPTFRAEKSKTRRHLTEFWMVEPEMAFAHLDDAMAVAEGMICSVVERVLETRKEELKVLERDTTKLENVKPPFPRLHYRDAMKLLHEKGSQSPYGGDFGGTDETLIAEAYDRPVVVHRFPSAIKAFYMEPDPDEPEFSLSADILAPEGYGEIVGGGERISDPDKLLSRIHEHQLPEEAFGWYIDLRRYGRFPHSGFGMGIERVVTWVCGLEHLRETIAFPRTLYRIYP